MSDEKTYVFDSASGSNIISALAPMLQNRGIDPSVLALMKDNDGFGNNDGGIHQHRRKQLPPCGYHMGQYAARRAECENIRPARRSV